MRLLKKFWWVLLLGVGGVVAFIKRDAIKDCFDKNGKDGKKDK